LFLKPCHIPEGLNRTACAVSKHPQPYTFIGEDKKEVKMNEIAITINHNTTIIYRLRS